MYGITTGFGAFKDRVIPPDDLAKLQVNLILSQCVGWARVGSRGGARHDAVPGAHVVAWLLGHPAANARPVVCHVECRVPLVPEQGSVEAAATSPLSHWRWA